jgi:fructose-1,6-bisphosphatase II
MERNLAFEIVRITEAAALAAARENGRGEEMAPELSAAEAIVRVAASINDFQGEIIIGDPQQGPGELLATGSRLGANGSEVEIALDPLEGGTSCALGGPNAMSLMAIAEQGGFLRCPPNTYMTKIATAADGRGVVDLDRTAADNLQSLAKVRGCYVEDLVVVVLDRPRHDSIVEEVRKAGARVKLIPHGDVAAAMAVARADTGVDVLMGTGGASQGILSAAAVKCLDGFMQCRFAPRSNAERDALVSAGIRDADRKCELEEMARGNIMFAATGVTDGEFLRGVKFYRGGAVSHSVVMRSASRTVRLMETHHHFDYKPTY